jgi:heme-binding NEAT domain protein
MLIAPAAAVQAEELVSSYSVTTAKYDDYSSTFTLDFEKPIRKNAAKKEVEEATSSMPAATAQSGTAKPRCNSMYSRNDANGHFTMQQKCGAKKTQWGFKINKNVQKNITGKVKERGFKWYISKKRKGTNSDHKEPKDYHFHGSFSAKNGDVITYSDRFTFPWKFTRTGHIDFSGKIVFQKRPGGAS